MHIKQVVLSGFRSYRDQLEVTPFHPAHNVVVGRNGSGKSNFFDAIRFVLLNVRFANLRQEERQQLLHEGAGANVMSAFVEIIFDNTDGRFPVDTEEVVLRRTIGLKKDEFFLNRKHISKGDVIHLLESAGFSRSNPYYIVQQGKVQALALMKDKERLELLKEVAGTRVYEDRREESLKILQETSNRREKIQEVIEYIEERLQELEEEKEELKEYQKLDKQKRALEYTLFDKELQKARSQLEEIEANRADEVEVANELHNAAFETHELISAKEKSLRVSSSKLKTLGTERVRLEEERHELIQQRTKLELEVRDLDERVGGDVERQSILHHGLAELKESIKKTEEQLQAVIPQYNEQSALVEQIERRLEECKRKTEVLFAKQGRSSQFKSASERDRFLESEMKELEDAIKSKDTTIRTVEEGVVTLKSTVNELSEEVEEQTEEMQVRFEALDQFRKRYDELRDRRNQVAEARKEAWRREREIDNELQECKQQLKKGEDDLRSTMPRDVRRGIETIKRLEEERKIPGIYGPLIELFDVQHENFRTAVEAAAGNSLFFVVVDTDETAAKLMKILEKENAGRVTFVPLNRIRASETTYPQSEDVVPLISKLQFRSNLRKVMLTVFGKKLLCRDLKVAASFAESAQMDCLTLDGDMVQRRGAMQGGYTDPQRSRMASMQQIREFKEKLSKVEQDVKKVKAEAQQADQLVTRTMAEMTKIEAEKSRAMEAHSQLSADVRRLKGTLKSKQKLLEEKESQLDILRKGRLVLEAQLADCNKEHGTELTSSLSSSEKEELRSLQTTISELQQQHVEQKALLEDLKGKKNGLETLLQENLLKRKEEAEQELDSRSLGALGATDRAGALEDKRRDLKEVQTAVKENATALNEVESEYEREQVSIRDVSAELEDLKQKDASIGEALENESRKAERLLNKRSMLLQKKDEYMRKIRELGTLPLAELETYKSHSLKQVMKELHRCNEQLRKYSHVNKKALDQYVNFSEQRGTLIERKKELDEGNRGISELIQVLDQRKDEAILRTFKGVSHHFSEVFRELVPDGKGQISIIRASANPAEEESESEKGASQSQNSSGVNTFEGVQVKVSFTGGGESYLMQQLSGGQKALVALAFIFAIQRCDPAPFYLFDEIDQALDSTHRAAVAALIQRQANDQENPAQFITSTFRPEMVKVADKCYGISHQSKVSNIHEMAKDETLEFIADIMAEEAVDEGANKENVP